MKPLQFRHKKGGLTLFGQAVSVAAVLLIGLVSYLTASPQAHELFHHDAGHEDHQCVVTSFAAGEGLYLAPAVELKPTDVIVRRVDFIGEEVLRDSVASLLPPACGPPTRGLIA